MKGHGAKFPRKQHQAIAALLEHSTFKEAAIAVGISETTLWRWFQNPDFQWAYRGAKRRVVELAISRLQQITSEAVETLREVMTNPESKDSPRVSAAKTILEMAMKAVELEDLAGRVERLERLIYKEQNPYGGGEK